MSEPGEHRQRGGIAHGVGVRLVRLDGLDRLRPGAPDAGDRHHRYARRQRAGPGPGRVGGLPGMADHQQRVPQPRAGGPPRPGGRGIPARVPAGRVQHHRAKLGRVLAGAGADQDDPGGPGQDPGGPGQVEPGHPVQGVALPEDHAQQRRRCHAGSFLSEQQRNQWGVAGGSMPSRAAARKGRQGGADRTRNLSRPGNQMLGRAYNRCDPQVAGPGPASGPRRGRISAGRAGGSLIAHESGEPAAPLIKGSVRAASGSADGVGWSLWAKGGYPTLMGSNRAGWC